MKYLYTTNNVDASIAFGVSDDFMTISYNITKLETETIRDAITLSNHDNLYQTMRYLRNSQVIDMCGLSSNVLLVEKMFYIQ